MSERFKCATEYVVIHCGNCGMAFAMTEDFYDRRVADHRSWYCPNGHIRHFPGKSKEAALREQLAEKNRQLSAKDDQLRTAEQQRDRISRSYVKIRTRITNRVCPCCNRTFENLLRHMRSQHPGMKPGETLKGLRTSFGLSQRELAAEIGIRQSSVSAFERGGSVSGNAATDIEEWIESNA